ncbi:MAG: hypothetical protein COB16_13120 [Rhodobacteraceae bacterium]|nr:MAG: hypothetical protein COB16_13120 [Paracoccaceae bacterium]
MRILFRATSDQNCEAQLNAINEVLESSPVLAETAFFAQGGPWNGSFGAMLSLSLRGDVDNLLTPSKSKSKSKAFGPEMQATD